jgi:hypothetical protein
MKTTETILTPPVDLDRLVRPGERMLIAITFPEELDESESCHPDLVLEDFLASRNDGSWQVEVYSILPKADRSHPQD